MLPNFDDDLFSVKRVVMVTCLYKEAKRESGVLWFSTGVVKATKVPSGILRKLSVKVCTKGSPMEMTFLEMYLKNVTNFIFCYFSFT